LDPSDTQQIIFNKVLRWRCLGWCSGDGVNINCNVYSSDTKQTIFNKVLRWRCFGGSFSSSGVNVHRRARVYNLFGSLVKRFNRRECPELWVYHL